MNPFIELTAKLESIKTQLKTEFIGLDEIIDQFIDAVTLWCTLKETQTSPMIINLWGMTGVGKTSLVNRFLELWFPEEFVLKFNMGSKMNFKNSIDSMERMYLANGKPCIFIFDEFQHARTMNGNQREREEPMDRLIWQLFDDGSFVNPGTFNFLNDLKEIIFNMELALERGVKVEKGKVVAGWEDLEYINGEIANPFDKFYSRDRPYFVNTSTVNSIFGQVRSEFKFKGNLIKYLMGLDGPQTLDFLKRVERESILNRKLNFPKALIFVIGNLDEAFEMSQMVSSDHNPDFYHEQSKKISFSRIKEALKERFRMEEISRLGNIHLIYPAFNSKFYKEFISNELQLISNRFEKAAGIKITFTGAVRDMIFEEGVIASQGFRPLRSTMRYLVESSLANMLKQAAFGQGDELQADMEGDDLVMKSKGLVQTRKRLHLPIRLAKRRKLNPQTQAITVVHEAGHALVHTIVFGKLPKSVSIATSDYHTNGFIESEKILDFNTYDLIYREVAVRLAGKKAEELVFKKDYHTSFGCIADMKSVTKILLEVRRQGVLPDKDLVIENKNLGTGRFLPESSEDNNWVKNQLEEISKMTAQLLEKHRKTLQIFIKVLLANKTMNATALEKALLSEGVNLEELLNSYPPITDYHSQLEEFMQLSEA